jgi:prolyl-tRNA editing enzyme YbaK/EbsC (Cys-tRNA(Pro) deacylase)
LGIAKRDTGYRASGASPVGTCGKLPVHVERPIRDWSRLYLNLGGRGFLVHIGPQAIARLLGAALARAAVVR